MPVELKFVKPRNWPAKKLAPTMDSQNADAKPPKGGFRVAVCVMILHFCDTSCKGVCVMFCSIIHKDHLIMADR